MEIEIAFAPDGSVRARVPGDQEGTDYTVAAANLDALLAVLAAGVKIERTTGIERHVHGPDGAHVHRHAHTR